MGVHTVLLLAFLVGLTLGALGGGGSILTLPILVFIAGIPAHKAVAMSMIVVAGTSSLGAMLHYWRGNFHLKATILFVLTGMVSAYFGSYLTHMISESLLLEIFAALMLVAGVAMVRGRYEPESKQACHIIRCLLVGSLVGGLTGFLGVGGGFMIVPSLVLFAGIEIKHAVGSSLAIITLNAAAGFVGQIQKISIDWTFTLEFLGLAILGMLAGLVVAETVRAQTLEKGFGWFIVVLALTVGGLGFAGISIS